MNYKQLLRVAYVEATLSPDPSNQNGALVVNDGNVILVKGHNHIPPGIDVDLSNRDAKMEAIVHAEEHAVALSSRLGVRTEGKTLICPWAACMRCGRGIIVAGFSKIVVHQPRMDTTPERWRGEVDKALAWIQANGIEIVYFDDRIPEAPPILANGQLWQP